MRFLPWIVALAAVLPAGACAATGSAKTASTTAATGSSPVAARPTTDARLVILSPTPNQVTGPDVTLQLQVTGGTVLPAAQVTGPLQGDQGHIHVSVDGRLVQMAYSTQADLTALTPGPHSVSAAWVAVDHLPFANRVVANVLFTVQGS
jgi:hypothetical protein